MVFFRKAVMEWFGYSRRERRATIVLLVILICFIMLPHIFSSDPAGPNDISYLLSMPGMSSGKDTSLFAGKSSLFMFDPNKASYDTLIMLGLTKKQAQTLVNYRQKSGKLRKAEDIRRIHNIDTATADRLIQYIKIEEREKYGHDTLKKSSVVRNKMIELNSADSAAFESLPGIGPVLSSRIVKYRKRLGGFVKKEQLKEVYGLKESAYQKISGFVYADSSKVNKIEINTNGIKNLSRLPYLDQYDLQSIRRYRELNGTINSIEVLVENEIISADKARKIAPYIEFRAPVNK
jgi:competence protein ComEA